MIQSGGLEVYHRDSNTWNQVKIPLELNALVINAGNCYNCQISYYIKITIIIVL